MAGTHANTSPFPSPFTSPDKGIPKLRSVDDQARSIINTLDQISSQLDSARVLRRQKSSAFTAIEKRAIDSTFYQTEDAINQVETLTERARFDIQVLYGRVRMNTRLLYVLRDSPSIRIALTQLGAASQNLNMAMFMLTNREFYQPSEDINPVMASENAQSISNVSLRAPPTYEETEFIAERRRKTLQRRASAQSSPLPYDAFKSLGQRSKSVASLPIIEYVPRPSATELEGVEAERDSTGRCSSISSSIPSIHVSEPGEEKEDDLDFLLFQNAIGFTPDPSYRSRASSATVSPPNEAAEVPGDHQVLRHSQTSFELPARTRSPNASASKRRTTASLPRTIEAQTEEVFISHLEPISTLHVQRSLEEGTNSFEVHCEDSSSLSITQPPAHPSRNSVGEPLQQYDNSAPRLHSLDTPRTESRDDLAKPKLVHRYSYEDQRRRSLGSRNPMPMHPTLASTSAPTPTPPPVPLVTMPSVRHYLPTSSTTPPRPSQRPSPPPPTSRPTSSMPPPPGPAPPVPPRPPKTPLHTNTREISFPPHPSFSPPSPSSGTSRSEVVRREAREPYVDWYSASAFSSRFGR